MERAITRNLVSHILEFSMHLLKGINCAAEPDWVYGLLSLFLGLLDLEIVYYIVSILLLHSHSCIPGNVHIITGPNYSGKSIYIKQAALIVFLAHIGSFVPADAAKVCLTDRIFCAIGGKLMTAEQSTFIIDLHQVGMMLRHATSRSLCLLDAFGKGTLTEDVIGLLGETIDHYMSMHAPPKVCYHLNFMPIIPFLDVIGLLGETIDHYMSMHAPPKVCCHLNFTHSLIPFFFWTTLAIIYNLVGVLKEVIRRLTFILDATTKGMHIYRTCDEKINAQDEQYKDVVEKMEVFDAINGDLSLFFSRFISWSSLTLWQLVWVRNYSIFD
ncbi:hypothetical protein E3N88_16481 [Mikania micrantha]|uniref:DNA mismatch repair proteins mutS family domain-containing protein n=1 Tax=Mikania micrantha TaxID=192012 RepID=A0A5N6P072_9ASTR|nr:hypothetical protein E3N88_16481 [Mikania micrantha]